MSVKASAGDVAATAGTAPIKTAQEKKKEWLEEQRKKKEQIAASRAAKALQAVAAGGAVRTKAKASKHNAQSGALVHAARMGNADEVKALLQSGVDVNARQVGCP